MSNAVTGERRCPLDLIGNEPVADFGCGDGDLAFFLETLGCQVHAFDYAPTNANHMKGICRLAEALGSSVRIHNVNVDAGFSLPAGRFGAVFAFGLLYHLKNPFGVLQSLARQSRHLFLSTRIARFAPDLSTRLQHIPVAYLLGDREANDDWTNYWIFSEAGLKRLLERTQWEVCDFFTVGDTLASNPTGALHDERAYCIARSRFPDPMPTSTELLRGWYPLEEEGWRWTEQVFSVRFRQLPSGGTPAVILRFALPDEIFARTGAITLSVRVDGLRLPSAVYSESGHHEYRAEAPARALESAEVEFSADKSVPAGTLETRALGLIVFSADVF